MAIISRVVSDARPLARFFHALEAIIYTCTDYAMKSEMNHNIIDLIVPWKPVYARRRCGFQPSTTTYGKHGRAKRDYSVTNNNVETHDVDDSFRGDVFVDVVVVVSRRADRFVRSHLTPQPRESLEKLTSSRSTSTRRVGKRSVHFDFVAVCARV